MAANPPPTLYAVTYLGVGDVEVYPLLPTQVLGTQIGSAVGTGGPALALRETFNSQNFYSGRVVEFRGDTYVITGDAAANTTGVYKKDRFGSGQWTRVLGTNNPGFSADARHFGLHVAHPNGIPTLCVLWYASNNGMYLCRTTDGFSGAEWGDNVATTLIQIVNGNVGPGLVYHDKLVHYRQVAGSEISVLDLRTLSHTTSTTLPLTGLSPNFASQTGVHIHEDTVFFLLPGTGPTRMVLTKIQGDVLVACVPDLGTGATTTPATAGVTMFTDFATGDLICISSTTGNIYCHAVANASTAPSVSDVSAAVFGNVDDPLRPGKYLNGNSLFNAGNRRWKVFVDTFSAPGTPRTFLWTWTDGNPYECWEWKGYGDGVTVGDSEIEIVAGGAGVSSGTFVIQHDSIGGGHRAASTARVEIGDVDNKFQTVIGGTRFFFRGYGSAAAGTITFRGGDQGSAPTTVVPIVGGSLAVENSLKVGLEVYYKFDNDGLDSSGNGRDLTLTGAVPFVGGLINQAADFPGAAGNYWARTVDDEPLEFLLGEKGFTISVWVNTDTLPGAAATILMKGDDGTNLGWQLFINSAGDLTFRSEVQQVTATAAAAISPAAGWQHIVVTGDGNFTTVGFVKVNVYVDNVLVASDDGNVWLNSAHPLRIGIDNSNTQPFDGQIDEVAIWTRRLLAAELTDIYNSGAGLELETIVAPPTTPAITANTITNFTPDGGKSLYSVVLDVSSVGVTEGEFGVIVPEFA